MSMNDAIKAYRAQKGEWNDLREQRVFRNIQENRRRKPRLQRWIPLAAGAVAAAVVVALGTLWPTGNRAPEASVAKTPAGQRPGNAVTEPPAHVLSPSTAETPSAPNASVITLSDAGRVTLREGADVSILSRSDDAVLLEQEEGVALYDIIHRRDRSVKVLVAGVEITVIGTLFEVSVEAEAIRVDVKRGVVQVDDGRRRMVLHAQEALSVALPLQRPSDRGLDSASEMIRGREGAEKISTRALFQAVDEARRNADWAAAARLLTRIIERNDSRISQASARFTLGKVERARGRHASAARVFERCAKTAPSRSLREDSLAEAALSWQAAGDHPRAGRIARTYLEAYPRGMYTSEMNGLIK